MKIAVGIAGLTLAALSCHAESVPACRLDDSRAAVVEAAVKSASSAFAELGKTLPFDDVAVNPRTAPRPRTLSIFVVKDAAASRVGTDGCPKGSSSKDDPLDAISVRGGCVTRSGTRLEIRCSAKAIRLLGDVNGRQDRPNPTLLYVLAHEIGHALQREQGSYAGQLESLALAAPPQEKIKALREQCDPVSLKVEEEADVLAISVLAKRVPSPPYRESTFSERGSIYWAVDQLNLTAHTWQQASLSAAEAPGVHAAFKPTSLPMPPAEIARNAQRFVCDALTKRTGQIRMPTRSRSHPSLEQRIRRVAEALKPIADARSGTSNDQPFASVSVLQEQVSPILSFLYRETGVYLEDVQREICMRANAPDPLAGCSSRK